MEPKLRWQKRPSQTMESRGHGSCLETWHKVRRRGVAEMTLRHVMNVSYDCRTPATDLLVDTTGHGRWRNPKQQKPLKFKYWGQSHDPTQVRSRARERALIKRQ